jgi:hypothetical protein
VPIVKDRASWFRAIYFRLFVVQLSYLFVPLSFPPLFPFSFPFRSPFVSLSVPLLFPLPFPLSSTTCPNSGTKRTSNCYPQTATRTELFTTWTRFLDGYLLPQSIYPHLSTSEHKHTPTHTNTHHTPIRLTSTPRPSGTWSFELNTFRYKHKEWIRIRLCATRPHNS